MTVSSASARPLSSAASISPPCMWRPGSSWASCSSHVQRSQAALPLPPLPSAAAAAGRTCTRRGCASSWCVTSPTSHSSYRGNPTPTPRCPPSPTRSTPHGCTQRRSSSSSSPAHSATARRRLHCPLPRSAARAALPCALRAGGAACTAWRAALSCPSSSGRSWQSRDPHREHAGARTGERGQRGGKRSSTTGRRKERARPPCTSMISTPSTCDRPCCACVSVQR